MPRGYSEVKTVEQCDASALLNLMNSCDCFLSVNVEYVREVKYIYTSKYTQGSIGHIHEKVAFLCVG